MICERCSQRFDTNNSVMLGICDACSKDMEHLTQLHVEIKKCTKCPLHKTATNKVPGRGFWAAPILFIGEAPGKNEDEVGSPFVGAAGQVLDTLIKYVLLPPNSYYITNILRCRPPSNRQPLFYEAEACRPFLERTIEYIKPKILVTLGVSATNYILNFYKHESTEKIMGAIRGKIVYDDDFKILPMYHPAAVLYNKELMDVMEEDFSLLIKLYNGLVVDRVIR